jgi:hypothetical protein
MPLNYATPACGKGCFLDVLDLFRGPGLNIRHFRAGTLFLSRFSVPHEGRLISQDVLPGISYLAVKYI